MDMVAPSRGHASRWLGCASPPCSSRGQREWWVCGRVHSSPQESPLADLVTPAQVWAAASSLRLRTLILVGSLGKSRSPGEAVSLRWLLSPEPRLPRLSR